MIPTETIALIKQNEGYRQFLYIDTVGKETIGYGRNLSQNGITESEAEFLLTNDITEIIAELTNFSWWVDLSSNRQTAFTDMAFNLGMTKFKEFTKMLAALDAKDYVTVAAEMKNSLWHQENTNRADADIKLVLEG